VSADDEPTWITYDDALAFHDVLIRLYGGAPGVRDAGVIDSALARPRHVFRYETRDLAVLAATYAHGIAKNHGFVDGNKRTAFVSALTFLRINSAPFKGDQAEAVVMVEGLASGRIDRDTFASWLRKMA
jgi:death-on-curing protein